MIGHKLNNLVDKAICLSLPNSPRRATFSAHAQEIGLEFEFFDAKSAINVDGRNKAHCERMFDIIELAENEGVENLLYMEDDCFYTSDLPKDFKLPEKFDLFYLGNFNMLPGQIKSEEDLYGKLHIGLCAHAVIINKRCFRFFKKNVQKASQTMDWYFLPVQKHGLSFGLVNPLAIQRDGYSDRLGHHYSHSDLMKKSKGWELIKNA